MSDPTERIEAALREVDRRFHRNDPRYFPRMARAVVDALGLTEEHRKLTNGWIQPMYGAPYYAMGLEPPPAVITHERRLVGPWEEDDSSG